MFGGKSFAAKSKEAGGTSTFEKKGGELVHITEYKRAVVIDYTKTYKIFVKLTAGPKGAWKEAHITNVVKIDNGFELIMGKTTDGNNFLGRIDGSPQKYKLPIDKKVRIGSFTVMIKLTTDPGAPKIPNLENMGDGNDAIEMDDDMPVESGAVAAYRPPPQQQQMQHQPQPGPAGYQVTSTTHTQSVGVFPPPAFAPGQPAPNQQFQGGYSHPPPHSMPPQQHQGTPQFQQHPVHYQGGQPQYSPMQTNFAPQPQGQPQFVLVGTDARGQPVYQVRQ